MSGAPLMFLKLGGSLLGDKRKPRSFRAAVVRRLGAEIRRARRRSPRLRLLLGHGGGGRAHFPARRFRTREGLAGGGGWRGFAETRHGVLEMHRRVVAALAEAGLHPVSVPPAAGVIALDGAVRSWDTSVIEALLAAGQVPLIHGDAVLDRRRGFTICSTETLFAFLARRLRPVRVVLACDVEGVYLDAAPSRGGRISRRRGGVEVMPAITRANIAAVRRRLRRMARVEGGARVWDVTGGMPAKVEQLYTIVRRDHRIESCIVSGLKPGAVEAALLGDEVGTAIRWE